MTVPFFGAALRKFKGCGVGCAVCFCVLGPLVAIAIIVGCDTVGAWLALLLPPVQTARDAELQTRCVANLRRIGVAIRAYHQRHGRLPPSFTVDNNGRPMHSCAC